MTNDQLSACADNFHVRYGAIFERQRDRLVLVKGAPESRMLTRAVLISVLGEDRAGKPLKVLSPQMQSVFGSFNGKLSFQRSPTRWVGAEHAPGAAEFLRGLE